MENEEPLDDGGDIFLTSAATNFRPVGGESRTNKRRQICKWFGEIFILWYLKVESNDKIRKRQSFTDKQINKR